MPQRETLLRPYLFSLKTDNFNHNSIVLRQIDNNKKQFKIKQHSTDTKFPSVDPVGDGRRCTHQSGPETGQQCSQWDWDAKKLGPLIGGDYYRETESGKLTFLLGSLPVSRHPNPGWLIPGGVRSSTKTQPYLWMLERERKYTTLCVFPSWETGSTGIIMGQTRRERDIGTVSVFQRKKEANRIRRRSGDSSSDAFQWRCDTQKGQKGRTPLQIQH